MSRDDYEASAALARDHSTGALLMALMRRTGPGHEPKYAALFPLTWLEFNRRQGFAGGRLPEEAEARSIPPLRLVATPPHLAAVVDDVPDQAVRCVCGRPGLPGLLHSASACRPEVTT